MKICKSGEPNWPMILASASSFAACQDKEKDRKKETENGKEKARDKEKEVLKDKTKDKEKGKEKAPKEKARSVLLFASSCMFWLANYLAFTDNRKRKEIGVRRRRRGTSQKGRTFASASIIWWDFEDQLINFLSFQEEEEEDEEPRKRESSNRTLPWFGVKNLCISKSSWFHGAKENEGEKPKAFGPEKPEIPGRSKRGSLSEFQGRAASESEESRQW